MPGFNSIDGLASGLSTTDIIDTIMQYERQPAALLEAATSSKADGRFCVTGITG